MAAVHNLGFLDAFLDLDFGQPLLKEHRVIFIIAQNLVVIGTIFCTYK